MTRSYPLHVYDLGGNILSKSSYALTTGTVGAVIGTSAYAYDDANWKDKLTEYKIGTADALPITYDVIGNPRVCPSDTLIELEE